MDWSFGSFSMDYWINNKKLEHITPPNDRFPEVGLFLALQRACVGSVFEFGCGDGRLSPAFNSKTYSGFDINPHAIKQAKLNNPDYLYVSKWKEADTFLAYTVFLHISDKDIQAVIDKAKRYEYIVIGEITGRHWRRAGNPPVFNRSVAEYMNMIEIVPNIIKVPYTRYQCDLDLMVFHNEHMRS